MVKFQRLQLSVVGLSHSGVMKSGMKVLTHHCKSFVSVSMNKTKPTLTKSVFFSRDVLMADELVAKRRCVGEWQWARRLITVGVGEVVYKAMALVITRVRAG